MDRTSKESRANIMKSFADRIDKIYQGKRYRKVVMFAEGTTTNNQGLIDFKKGAFVLKKPLKLTGIKYESNMANYIVHTNLIDGIICSCLCYYTKTRVIDLDYLVYPKNESMSWEEFAEEVKTLMCNEFGFKNFKGNFKEKLEFEQRMESK